jgi:hypothetical protein
MTDELEKLRAENARLQRWLAAPVIDRLGEYLCSLATKRDERGRLVIVRPPTQEQMGQAIGAVRECVSRTLRLMAYAGMLEQRGRGQGRRWIALSRELERAALERGAVVPALEAA